VAVGKVAAHLCLTLIIKELKISVEQDKVVTTLNIIFSVVVIHYFRYFYLRHPPKAYHFLGKVELKLCRVRHDPSMSTTTTHALERILLKDELFNKTWGEFVVTTIGSNT
jgi:hypothetical protein